MSTWDVWAEALAGVRASLAPQFPSTDTSVSVTQANGSYLLRFSLLQNLPNKSQHFEVETCL